MSVLRKVPASAGMQWVLGSLVLLRHAPLALARLGLLWAFAVTLLLAVTSRVWELETVGPYLTWLSWPPYMGGLLWALREVDQRRRPKLVHLLAGVMGNRPIHLFIFMFPYFVATVILLLVLLLILGFDGIAPLKQLLNQLIAQRQPGAAPDPETLRALLDALPVNGLTWWLSGAITIFIMLWLIQLVMLPLVMFHNVSGIRAMLYSLYAFLYNISAMAVFLLFLGITLVAGYFALQLLLLALTALLGAQLAAILTHLLLLALLMPLLAGAMYAAWKQMLAPLPEGAPPAPRLLEA